MPESVADQCPLDGGSMVYAARGALQMLSEQPLEWSDDCGSGERGAGDEKQDALHVSRTSDYKFYPNPVQDVSTLFFPATAEGSRTVQILDMLGQVLTQEQLPSTGGVMPLDLGGFANGVYWLIVKEKGKVVFSEKIVKL